jgi:hypothetical protein
LNLHSTVVRAGLDFLKIAGGGKGRAIADDNWSRSFGHKDKVQRWLEGNYLFVIVNTFCWEGHEIITQGVLYNIRITYGSLKT